MTDFRLKVFVTVAEQLSFTRASEALYISQPAISKHIQELESQYSVRLFERLGNRIVLTSAGELLLEHCRTILAAYEILTYDMQMLHKKQCGKLRIGASTTIAHYIIPSLLAQFKRKFPDVEFSLISGNSHEIERALQAQEIDLGLVEGSNRLLSLKYISLASDQLVAVVSTKQAYKNLNTISLDAFCKIPLVLREGGSGTLEIIKQALTENHIKTSDLNILTQLDSTESIKGFIEQSNAMAILSTRSVQKEISQGELKVVNISGLKLSREFTFMERQGVNLPLANSFINFALKQFTN